MLLKKVIEALVFASQKPLSLKEIVAALRAAVEDSDEDFVRELAKTKEAEAAALLEELKIDYIQANTAFQLVEQASGWAIVTRPEYGIWVRQLYPESKPTRLSGPALETLAIIAYRQPITRADIEAVRGVAVDGVMQSLLDRSLIRIAGRADVPGRPLLYETSQVFMEHFGLRNLDELPNSDELRKVRLPTAPPSEAAKKAAAQAAANPELPVAPPVEGTTLGQEGAGETPAAEGAPAITPDATGSDLREPENGAEAAPQPAPGDEPPPEQLGESPAETHAAPVPDAD